MNRAFPYRKSQKSQVISVYYVKNSLRKERTLRRRAVHPSVTILLRTHKVCFGVGKDLVGGVIGVQNGPSDGRVHYGSRLGACWDAGCGNDREHPPRIYCSGQGDHNDLP
jgi:hypothetical protein